MTKINEVINEYKEKLVISKTGWTTCDVDPIRDAREQAREEEMEKYVKKLEDIEFSMFSEHELLIIASAIRVYKNTLRTQIEVSGDEKYIESAEKFIKDLDLILKRVKNEQK